MMQAENWLKQPGILKKLQMIVALSLCLNIFLLLNQLAKPEKKINNEIKRQEKIKTSKVGELEIKNFIKEYLNYFFSTGLVAASYIEKHSEEVLYETELKDQLAARTQKNLKSDFRIFDFYIETLSASQYKVILVGIESFQSKDYKEREITMILVLDYLKEEFTVTTIPKFEIKA